MAGTEVQLFQLKYVSQGSAYSFLSRKTFRLVTERPTNEGPNCFFIVVSSKKSMSQSALCFWVVSSAMYGNLGLPKKDLLSFKIVKISFMSASEMRLDKRYTRNIRRPPCIEFYFLLLLLLHLNNGLLETLLLCALGLPKFCIHILIKPSWRIRVLGPWLLRLCAKRDLKNARLSRHHTKLTLDWIGYNHNGIVKNARILCSLCLLKIRIHDFKVYWKTVHSLLKRITQKLRKGQI